MSISKILISNRGEIAARIIRTCKSLGIGTVAVYSYADRHSIFVELADESVYLGKSESSESYLNIPAIIKAAKDTGADAVHPGYGFLSENAEFARALKEEGIIFIGPSPEVIELMGDKVQAKKLALKCKVPLAPGLALEEGSELKTAKKFIKKEGLPVLVKAAAGGGGRGMRKVYDESELEDALAGAAREAKAFFANGDLLLEKLIEDARHVELQVFGDSKGNILTLRDRDCTMQRNHQKVIEEAPAPGLSDKLRTKMTKAGESLCKEAGYQNAGTVEFLVTRDENFYFLEVNSRLQVEHPVTEEITGLDLVELQIRIAEGESLKKLVPKDALNKKLHSIELRICAESPAENFQASTGTISAFSVPDISSGGAVRYDSGFAAGDRVTHYYDSMLGKLIVTRETREQAIEDTIKAVAEIDLRGLSTNLSFLSSLLNSSEFKEVTHNTHTAANYIPDGESLRRDSLRAASIGLLITSPLNDGFGFRAGGRSAIRKWFKDAAGFFEVVLEFEDAIAHARAVPFNEGPEASLSFEQIESTNSRLKFHENGVLKSATAKFSENIWWIRGDRGMHSLQVATPPLRAGTAEGHVSNEISSPLPGKIIAIKAPEGTDISEGDPLLVIESMKMEHILTAPLSGRVEEIMVKSGDVVEANTTLARLEFDA